MGWGQKLNSHETRTWAAEKKMDNKREAMINLGDINY
jgi:hypothetical protein